MDKRVLAVTMLAALLGVGAVNAAELQQSGRADSTMSRSASPPASENQWGSSEPDVSAVAGGVGLNARARLSGEASADHNVKMVFTLTTGNYLADVQMKVLDKKGHTVLEGVSQGPWLYAKLPPGKYTAQATYNGNTVTRQLKIGNRGERVAYFRWPVSVEQDGLATADVAPILGTGAENLKR
jgi:hypothetical protein